MKNTPRTSFLWVFLLSILLHGLFFFGAKKIPSETWLSSKPSELSVQEVQPKQVLNTELLSQKDFERRVVENTRFKELQNPPQTPAKYRGEFTQRVEKETVAKDFGSSTKDLKSALERFGKIPMPLPPKEDEIEASDEKLTSSNLAGNTGHLGHGSLDHLDPDMAVGAQTLLNTDEYRYAGFFNRFKREVAPRWEPMIQAILTKIGKQLRAGQYSTRTRFTLAADGTILGVEILSSSGVAPFDNAAKESILQILRIKNPPSRLQEGDGKYRIELGFLVNLDSVGSNFNYVPDPRL